MAMNLAFSHEYWVSIIIPIDELIFFRFKPPTRKNRIEILGGSGGDWWGYFRKQLDGGGGVLTVMGPPETYRPVSQKFADFPEKKTIHREVPRDGRGQMEPRNRLAS